MNHDRSLLQALAQRGSAQWSGTVYRHMFANYRPERENTLGARWNPPEVPAIYACLARETVIAEAEYQLSLEPLRPPVRRTVYTIKIALSAVLDLSTTDALKSVGLTKEGLGLLDHSQCRAIGGAAEHLGHDGLLVPSARSTGINLVIYPNRQTQDYLFEVIGEEVLFDPAGSPAR